MTAALRHSHRRRSPKQAAIDVMLRQDRLFISDWITLVIETTALTPARHCGQPKGECMHPSCVRHYALMEAAGIARQLGKAKL